MRRIVTRRAIAADARGRVVHRGSRAAERVMARLRERMVSVDPLSALTDQENQAD